MRKVGELLLVKLYSLQNCLVVSLASTFTTSKSTVAP